MDDRQRRIGENEVIFREVNERVRETNETFDIGTGIAEFVCECGTASCVERIRLSLAEYEDVRADPTTFLVRPGHVIAEVEIVVRSGDGYEVVQKHRGEAERIALETDPRSD